MVLGGFESSVRNIVFMNGACRDYRLMCGDISFNPRIFMGRPESMVRLTPSKEFKNIGSRAAGAGLDNISRSCFKL